MTMTTTTMHRTTPPAPASRQDRRLRRWEQRQPPAQPTFPEPDPPIYKPLG